MECDRRPGPVHHVRALGGIGASDIAHVRGDRAGLWWAERTHRFACRSIHARNPYITNWVRKLTGQNDVPMYVRMGLKDLIRTLMADCDGLCAKHHDAGNDAEMHWRVCRELKRLAAETSPDPHERRLSGEK